MQNSSKVRSLYSTPKGNSYRRPEATPSPRGNFTVLDSRSQDKSPPNTHTRDYATTSYIQKTPNNVSNSSYKSKRPPETKGFLEDEGLGYLSNSASYEFLHHHYDPQDAYDLGRGKNMVQSVQKSSIRNTERSPDYQNDVIKEAPEIHNVNNKAFFIAEKVYSMKMRTPGIMGALTPISKSKSPNHTPMSRKKESSPRTRPGLKGLESPSSSSRHEDSSQTDLTDQSYSNSILRKKNSLNSQSSIERFHGEGKYVSPAQNNMFKNSVGESNMAVNRSVQSQGRSPKGTASYQMMNTMKKERAQNELRMRIETFSNKVSTVMWQIGQRNKRKVLVLLLEMLHQHKVLLTQYLEKRAKAIKSKHFYMWQEFLLEKGLQRQRTQTERIEEMKLQLAVNFCNKKLLTKTFYYILKQKNESKQKPQKKPEISTPKSPKAPLLLDNSASAKSLLGSPKRSTILPSTPKKTATPQKQQGNSGIKQKGESPDIKVKKPNALSSFLKNKEGASSGTVSRSESKSKLQKSAVASPRVEAQPVIQNRSQVAVVNRYMTVDTPSFAENSFNYPCFEKSLSHFQEQSDIEEVSELTQVPEKPPTERRNSALDQSFGEQTEEPVQMQRPFQSILANILKGSNSGQQAKGTPVKRTAESANSSMRKEKSMTPKSARNDNSGVMKKFQEIRRNSTSVEKYTKNETTKVYKSPRRESTPKVLKKTAFSPKPKKNEESFRGASKKVEKTSEEIAEGFRREKLLKLVFKSLSKAAREKEEEKNDKLDNALAQYHLNLKIKALSSLLENFVNAFKDKRRAEEHYKRSLLKTSFMGWSKVAYNFKKQDEKSEAVYNNIATRFRFIVLAEKGLRQWKEFIKTKKMDGMREEEEDER